MFYIELYKNCPCECKKELDKEELKAISEYATLNTINITSSKYWHDTYHRI